ncbi:hypothetical protein EIP86_009350 [Pleurotus ostreatoroseus]|nr:hypothetical protein EIP86_009350 [Pleurotus ostreatoroseus]
MTTQSPRLPADRADQVYVSVKALSPGKLHLPHAWVFQDCVSQPESAGSWVPTFSFLIEHPSRGRAMFDLGLRKHAKGYPPVDQESIDVTYATCEHDAADILQSGGVDLTEIKTIIYRGRPAARRCLPHEPGSEYQALPLSRNVTYVDFTSSHANTSPFGPFTHAVDLYADGSLYLVDAPGHIPGHLAAAARVGPGAFVFLAGDCCHARACYDPGTRLVSEENHDDVARARETVGRLVRLNEEYGGVVVVLAHEREREAEMPMFPRELNGWAVEAAETKRKVPHSCDGRL